MTWQAVEANRLGQGAKAVRCYSFGALAVMLLAASGPVLAEPRARVGALTDLIPLSREARKFDNRFLDKDGRQRTRLNAAQLSNLLKHGAKMDMIKCLPTGLCGTQLFGRDGTYRWNGLTQNWTGTYYVRPDGYYCVDMHVDTATSHSCRVIEIDRKRRFYVLSATGDTYNSKGGVVYRPYPVKITSIGPK